MSPSPDPAAGRGERLHVDVRPFAAGDREGVRALLLKTFGSSQVFDRYADGNPLGEFVGIVAEHDGAIVGFNMWNPWLIQTREGPVTAFQSGASSVDDSMRGQGVFGKLLRAGEDVARGRGIPWFFGFPNPASHAAFMKHGWEHAKTLRMFVCPMPSLGFRDRRVGETSGIGTAAAQFVAWRYARAGAEARALELGGTRVVVYTRTQRRAGITQHKILDVLDEHGRRVPERLSSIARALPGPGVTWIRATPPPSAVVPWVPLKRPWDTPLILKRLLADDGPDHALLRDATYWYGDIDAS
jgi:predicted N-acetyltransferase YhbS